VANLDAGDGMMGHVRREAARSVPQTEAVHIAIDEGRARAVACHMADPPAHNFNSTTHHPLPASVAHEGSRTP
jgi:hypothetical protein